MDLDNNNNNNNAFDWANDAYMALNHTNRNAVAGKWSSYGNVSTSLPPAAFTLPTALASPGSVERYGQVTPPDELSPAAAHGEGVFCEGSLPVELQRNEVPWPIETKIQSLANYDLSSPQQPQQRQTPPEPESKGQPEPTDRANKRRRTSMQTSANQNAATLAKEQQTSAPVLDPQPPKRKRGRPKSQPQPIEGFSADGFPFQVTSARQSHLEKNRVAAHKCRQRKKEYINSLESRAREGSAKNKALKDHVALLREEVLELKNEVLRHAGCGFWAVDEYLARCAGDLLGMDAQGFSRSTTESQIHSPTMDGLTQQDRTLQSPYSHATSEELEDEYKGLELINDMDESIDIAVTAAGSQ